MSMYTVIQCTNWLIIKEKNYAVAYNDQILCMSQIGMDRMTWFISNVFPFAKFYCILNSICVHNKRYVSKQDPFFHGLILFRMTIIR
jgi:hypothetical protein